jgi:hypothetical protein
MHLSYQEFSLASLLKVSSMVLARHLALPPAAITAGRADFRDHRPCALKHFVQAITQLRLKTACEQSKCCQ